MAGPAFDPNDPNDPINKYIASKLAGGSTNPDTQLIQGGDGQWYLVDKATGKATPLAGVPGKSAAPSTKELRQDGNGNWVIVDTATGKATPVEGMAPTPPKQETPKTTAPGSPNDQFLAQTDPTTGAITWIPNKNYVPPTSSATRAIVNANNTDQYIVTMNPDGTTSKQPNPNWVNPAIKEQAQALADKHAEAVKNGIESNQQAISMFDRELAMLTAGQNAADSAVAYAKDATVNQVGPQFGQHLADALSGRGVNFQGADFMYQTPDYADIARKATAAAIAHLSPYAAQIAATQQPPGGYGGSASGAYIPGGGSGASQATGTGMTLTPAQLAQFTSPAPPQPGFMAQGSTAMLTGIPGGQDDGRPRVIGAYRPGG